MASRKAKRKSVKRRRRNAIAFLPLSALTDDSDLMRAYKDARAELGPSRQMAKEVNAEFQRVDRDTTAVWKDGRPAQAILDRYKAAKKESEEAFAYAAKVDDYVAKLGAAVRKRKIKKNPGLYAYQVQYSNGSGFKKLGAFPARSRTDALAAARTELIKKGEWTMRTKLATSAVPMGSTAAKHKNVAQGFMDSNGVFHPIRSSADYDSDRAGDATGRSRKTRSAKKRKLKAKAGATARHKAGLRAKSSVKSLASRRLARTTSTGKRLATKKKRNQAYVDLVIKGRAQLTNGGWKIGRKVIPQGRGVMRLSSGYYLDKSTGTVYAKRARNGRILKTAKRLGGAVARGAGGLLVSAGDALSNPRRKSKRRNSGAADRRSEFAGKTSGSKDLYFPDGTPEGLSTLGPLKLICTESGDLKPGSNGGAYLCQGPRGHLYVGATRNAPLVVGAQNFGKVSRVEYECAKPHLGEKKSVVWYHDFESPLPELRSNESGELKFHGGGYQIKREGIVG